MDQAGAAGIARVPGLDPDFDVAEHQDKVQADPGGRLVGGDSAGIDHVGVHTGVWQDGEDAI